MKVRCYLSGSHAVPVLPADPVGIQPYPSPPKQHRKLLLMTIHQRLSYCTRRRLPRPPCYPSSPLITTVPTMTRLTLTRFPTQVRMCNEVYCRCCVYCRWPGSSNDVHGMVLIHARLAPSPLAAPPSMSTSRMVTPPRTIEITKTATTAQFASDAVSPPTSLYFPGGDASPLTLDGVDVSTSPAVTFGGWVKVRRKRM